jgi:hypothetical protein
MSNYNIHDLRDRAKRLNDIDLDQDRILGLALVFIGAAASGAKVVDSYVKWKNAKTWRMEVKRRNAKRSRNR